MRRTARRRRSGGQEQPRRQAGAARRDTWRTASLTPEEEAADDAAREAEAARAAEFYKDIVPLKEGCTRIGEKADDIRARAVQLEQPVQGPHRHVHGTRKRKRGISCFYDLLGARARDLGDISDANDVKVRELCDKRWISHGISPAEAVKRLRERLRKDPSWRRRVPRGGGTAPQQAPPTPPPDGDAQQQPSMSPPDGARARRRRTEFRVKLGLISSSAATAA